MNNAKLMSANIEMDIMNVIKSLDFKEILSDFLASNQESNGVGIKCELILCDIQEQLAEMSSFKAYDEEMLSELALALYEEDAYELCVSCDSVTIENLFDLTYNLIQEEYSEQQEISMFDIQDIVLQLIYEDFEDRCILFEYEVCYSGSETKFQQKAIKYLIGNNLFSVAN